MNIVKKNSVSRYVGNITTNNYSLLFFCVYIVSIFNDISSGLPAVQHRLFMDLLDGIFVVKVYYYNNSFTKSD